MNQLILGMIAAASLVAALFFLRFWRTTGDRLFLIFALAFGVEGFNRIALASSPTPNEGDTFFYLVRLGSFVLILLGILDKNLSRGR